MKRQQMLGKVLIPIIRRAIQWLEGTSLSGIPAWHATYARRVSWLHDRRGNQMCVRADCDYRAHFPFAISKIDRHLRSDHDGETRW